MNALRSLSGATWQEVLKLLGTGDFIRIEFRPPREDEKFLGKINGFPEWGVWWICEADYHEITSAPDGAVLGSDLVSRRFAYRLHDYDEVV